MFRTGLDRKKYPSFNETCYLRPKVCKHIVKQISLFLVKKKGRGEPNDMVRLVGIEFDV